MHDRTRSLLALVLLFTALAMGVLWWQSSRSRAELQDQVLLQAGQRSLHLADAMAGQVQGVLSSVDLTLKQLRSEWARGDPAAFAQRVQEALDALPEGFVSHAVVADAQGRVVYDSLGRGLGVNIADRDYFRAHTGGGDRLAIGAPVRSRLDGRWVFAVSRPLQQGRRFVGTVHLTLGTEAMARKLATLSLSEQDVVILIHREGHVLARSKGNTAAMGQRAPDDRPYMAQPDVRSGVYRVPGLVDGVRRTYGWYRMPQSGALVAIGLADTSVLDPLAPVLRRQPVDGGGADAADRRGRGAGGAAAGARFAQPRGGRGQRGAPEGGAAHGAGGQLGARPHDGAGELVGRGVSHVRAGPCVAHGVACRVSGGGAPGRP